MKKNALLLILLSLVGFAHAQFWGAKKPLPIDTPKDSLKRGQFTWAPELSKEGPIVVLVNLDQQFAYTYRNGILIGIATVSTGKAGHRTPTGVFVTTYKDADHRSSKYNNAAMPYTQRFTNSGIALHAGGIPNYPSSHGCVHLPSEYARLLFQVAPVGMTVVVTDRSKNLEEVSHPAFLSPVTAKGKTNLLPKLESNETYRWDPDLSTTGPLSLIVSGADQRLVVFRNGIEIGRSKITIRQPEDSLGTHVYIAHQSANAEAVAGTPIYLRWLTLPLEDLSYQKVRRHPFLEGRIQIPDPFMQQVSAFIEPGTHILVTDATLFAGNTGTKMAVLSSHPEAK
jgi:hypothetical protein